MKRISNSKTFSVSKVQLYIDDLPELIGILEASGDKVGIRYENYILDNILELKGVDQYSIGSFQVYTYDENDTPYPDRNITIYLSHGIVTINFANYDLKNEAIYRRLQDFFDVIRKKTQMQTFLYFFKLIVMYILMYLVAYCILQWLAPSTSNISMSFWFLTLYQIVGFYLTKNTYKKRYEMMPRVAVYTYSRRTLKTIFNGIKPDNAMKYFVGVIVTIVLGLITNYLYDLFK